MQSTAMELESVVITAQVLKEKKRPWLCCDEIKSTEIEQRAEGDVARGSWVIINQTSGTGSGTNINIRGFKLDFR
jgi:hypothetical protein